MIHDASGCTGNYTGYDEPRWYDSHSLVYCSGLREMDAILGNDEKFIQKIENAANDLKPNFLCFLGSPVPMVIGTDLEGIAAELEERTGIPSMGLATTGLHYYDKGVSDAYIAFAKKFFPLPQAVRPSGDRINILGLTPLDFSNNSNADDLIGEMEKRGFTIQADFSMVSDFHKACQAPSASVNLVVSKSGLGLAEYMKKRYQIPYVVGVPAGELAADRLAVMLKETMADKRERVLETAAEETSQVLIIGEEVLIRSLAFHFREERGIGGIQTAVLFGGTQGVYRQDSLALNSESDIRKLVNSGRYHTIIADPLIRQLIREKERVRFIELPHVAVSSKICWDHAPQLMGERLSGSLFGFQ
ncbi:nitrogenase component 1 [Lacrimispora sp. BS-2]|uniref:Nitrogenase component 1 n=1 Tax=Lacrimispora sp. BS-2 TaxID=3151850 RepID=A0AAU7PK99_9FIRM